MVYYGGKYMQMFESKRIISNLSLCEALVL